MAALGRLLSLLPTVLLTALVAFWLVGPAGTGLPRFLNPSPRDAADRAAEAVALLAAGGAEAATGRAMLDRLGGAALPHVLPRLDTLAPGPRARVALALVPTAERMGVLEPGEVTDAAAAASFFDAYWAARSLDLKPAAVERVVRRLGDRALPLRREQVRALDTLALPALMAELDRAAAAGDVERVRRLALAASRITGHPWTLPPGGDRAAAVAVERRWALFWLENESQWATFDGTARSRARLSETELWRWASRAWITRLGSAPTGQPWLREIGDGGLRSLGLAGAVLLLGALLGALGGAALAAGRRGARTDLALSALALGAGVPLLTRPADLGVGAAALVLLVATSVGARQRACLAETLSDPVSICHRAQGAGRGRVVLVATVRSLPGVIAQALAELPAVLLGVALVEALAGATGLGHLAVVALRAGDPTGVAALGALGALAAALAELSRDALLAARPPWRALTVRGSR